MILIDIVMHLRGRVPRHSSVDELKCHPRAVISGASVWSVVLALNAWTQSSPAFLRAIPRAGAVILARITSGLWRAAALEAGLCQRAARGQDLAPSPIRLPATPGPRPARLVAPPEAQPEPQRLTRLPTEQEIAAEVRRRPVGAVIADICRDLGIMPGQLDRAFWDELSRAIIIYGGGLSDRTEPRRSAAPPRLPALATGPP
ncbi:MAG TPA: hypothetical protein VGI78_15805 [Acetobacteraceae bacterium]